MGRISIILAALLCAGAPMAANAIQAEGIESNSQFGKEKISTIRKNYETGKYNTFLKAMDKSFRNADLQGLIEMRSNQMPSDAFEQQFIALQEQRNEELLAAVADDNSPFAMKVRAAAFQVASLEQERAESKLASFLIMAPNTGASEDENALIDLSIEYEYKTLHASMPDEEIDPALLQEHLIALRMEKMEKMANASQIFQDAKLQTAILLTESVLDERLARNLDGQDLNRFETPTTETEKKVVQILSHYKAEFAKLFQN